MACDVLSLEWNSEGRDVHIVEPVLCYLEINYNLNIIRDSIWYGEFKILKYKPKMLILSNANGASNNYNIAKLAKKIGIIVVEFISEGVYAKFNNKDDAESIFWGWNKDKVLYSNLVLYWSDQMKSNLQGYINNEVLQYIEISGATGFDRYKMFKFMNKEEFCFKYKKRNYKKIIGIAGWGFDAYAVDDDLFKKGSLINATSEEKEFFINSRNKINQIYKNTILENEDVLFVLKYHPAVHNKDLTEFKNLSNLENVLEITTEEAIENLINVSDLWICFESTTCIEGWLLKKQTIFVNPEINFERSNLYFGNAIAKTEVELKEYIKTFYRTNVLPTFKDKEKERAKLIKNHIGYDDGFNHKRAGDKIIKLFAQSKKHNIKYLNIFFLYMLLKSLIRYIVFQTPLKLFVYEKYKLIHSYELKYNSSQRNEIIRRYHVSLKDFYLLQNKKEGK